MPTRTLNVQISGDSRGFSRAVRDTERDTDRLGRVFDKLGRSVSGQAESMDGLRVSMVGMSGSASRLLPALAAATPALVALGGAAAAAAGSLTAAAGGAAALGTGLVASMAPVLVVAKQVTSRFEEVKKAYDAVQTAQREGTDAARKNARQLLGDLSKSERAFVDTMGRLQGLQERVLGGASDRIFTTLSGAIERLVPIIETLEKPFDRLGDAIARVISKASRSLAGDEWSRALRKFVDSASALVGPMSRIFGSIGSIMRDIALATLPMLRDGFRDLAQWFGQLDEAATRGTIREVIQDLVKHTQSWWDLTKEVGELIFRIFNGGAQDGKSLIDSLTGIVREWNKFLETREGQREMREFFRNAVRVTRDLFKILGAVTGAIFDVSNAFLKFDSAVQKAGDAVREWLIQAFKDVIAWFKTLPDKFRKAIDDFAGAAFAIGKAIVKGIVEGILSAPKAIIGALDKLVPGGGGGAPQWPVGRTRQTGDAIGRSFVPRFGGSLMGARPEMAPIAGLGSRFGLGVSSGRRPGAITSSGNQSWHATGEALDLSGPPSAMMGFARFMSKRAGELAELIYTPLGGWNNGSRYTPTGKLAADHYDHVHVAMDVGTPGQGDGIGQAVNAARAAGFRGQALQNIVAIAGAESKYDAEALNPRYPDYSVGMTQINMLAHGSKYGTEAQLKNPFTNFRAAWKVSGGGKNFGPWSTWPTAAKAYMDRARAAISGGGGGGGSGGGGAGGGTPRVPRVGPNAPLGFEGQLAKVGVTEAKARAADSLPGLLRALTTEKAIKQRRLKRVQKLLRGRRSKESRKALLAEQASLIGDIAELSADIGEFGADLIIGGATTISGAEGLEAGVAPAADASGGAGDGDNGAAALAAAIRENTAAIEASRRFAEAVQQTEAFQLKKYLADVLSGQIVGYGVVPRSFTPGSGVEYAY